METIEDFERKYEREAEWDRLKYFRKTCEYLGKTVHVKIDRPLGSIPKKEFPDFIYELNYGFVPNTTSGDGEELDCYILGIEKPIQEFKGKCIAFVHRLEEIDDKLIIVPEGKEYSSHEIERDIYFTERYHKSVILR